MPTPEEKHYDSMDTLLAPMRWAKSLVQLMLLIGIVILIGLGYPFYVLLGGDGYPLDPLHVVGAFMVSFLTLVIIVSFFYRPYYTMFGGVVAVITITCLFEAFDGEAFAFKFIMLGYFIFGDLYKFIRRRRESAAQKECEAKQPEPKKMTFAKMVEEARLERRQREYDALSPDDRATKTRLFGDDYFNWPDKFNKGSRPDTTREDAGELFNTKSLCERCNKAYELLDLPLEASDEEVNSKKRAFAELFHGDRLGAMSESARRIANEQHQSVNEACSHILTCPVRAKVKGRMKGSESAPATHQSTCEAMAREDTEQPPPASSSGGSDLEKRDHEPSVPTEQERIDALDATRRKVDETTNEIREFLGQMKRQRQSSLGSMQRTNDKLGTTTTIGGKLLP